jgi:hypothetical protein
MHVPINVKSSNNISEWQVGFNSAFKGLMSFPPFVVISILMMSFLPPRLRRSQEFIAFVLIFIA